MMRQDYILRMIEQIGQMIARILHHRSIDDVPAAREEVNQGLQDLLGLTVDEVLEEADRSLLSRCLDGGPSLLARQRALALIALLNQEAENCGAQGNAARAELCHLKCLTLLLECPPAPEVADPEFVPRVERLLLGLEKVSLPLGTQGAIMYHFERVGDFARAEDWLFRMRDASNSDPAVLELGDSFFKRLRGLSDVELEAGNLPREEVLSGQREWQARA